MLVRKPEGKGPLGRRRLRWYDIKMDVKEIETEGVKSIQLAQDRVQWRVFVNTVTNLWVPYKAGDLLRSLVTIS
jgi:hypothetical protein